MPKLSRRQLQRQARKLLRIESTRDLAKLLQFEEFRVKLHALKPKYHYFQVKKRNGKTRHIEEPNRELKSIQDRLSFYLGALYYMIKTACCFGFVFTTKQDKVRRTIANNARQHIGHNYMINADLKDFFHQIRFGRVLSLFRSDLFHFEDDLCRLLTKLCTNQDRLPMGAPTSPVLSNFAVRELDRKLMQFSDWIGWTFTRYADDYTFSSKHPLQKKDFDKVKQIVAGDGFEFNPDKIHFYTTKDKKLVTGVQVLSNRITMPEHFFTDINKYIDYLAGVVKVSGAYGRQEEWIKNYKGKIKGMLQFASDVMGETNPHIIKLHRKYDHAIHPEPESGTRSWLEFTYF